jgi:hypothetical protein
MIRKSGLRFSEETMLNKNYRSRQISAGAAPRAEIETPKSTMPLRLASQPQTNS